MTSNVDLRPLGDPAPAPTSPAAARSLTVVFVLEALNRLRYYQAALELLIERGHNVRLLLESDRLGPNERAWLERMGEHGNFACDLAGPRNDPWRKRRLAVRRGLEYVHFLGKPFRGLRLYSMKALRRSPPPAIRRLARLPLVRTPLGLHGLHGVLSAIDRALPPSPHAAAYLQRVRADVVVLGSVDNRASEYAAYGVAAREHGFPVAITVASWDNLTTRPRMRLVPDALLVWNDMQVQEAVELHHVPAENVVVTGAPNFDQWFSWSPRPRHEFLTRVGLDPSQPVILWVGGALHNWEAPEPVLVKAWLRALRSSEDPILRDAGVILRPHPGRLEHWRREKFLPSENLVVWPPGNMTMPTEDDQKADFYDSIYHAAAVVGVNTSAMIEASIIGRPVLVVLHPNHHDSQLGSLHFSRLIELAGPALHVANSIEELLDELSAVLSGRAEEAPESGRSFVEQFVRPHGFDQAATPLFVEAIEQLAERDVRARREPLWVPVLRALIVLPGQVGQLFTNARGAIVTGYRGRVIRRTRKAVATGYRRRVKSLRRARKVARRRRRQARALRARESR